MSTAFETEEIVVRDISTARNAEHRIHEPHANVGTPQDQSPSCSNRHIYAMFCFEDPNSAVGQSRRHARPRNGEAANAGPHFLAKGVRSRHARHLHARTRRRYGRHALHASAGVHATGVQRVPPRIPRRIASHLDGLRMVLDSRRFAAPLDPKRSASSFRSTRSNGSGAT